MKNSFCLSGLAVALLGLGVVHGQGPTDYSGPLGIPPANPPSSAMHPGPSGPAFDGPTPDASGGSGGSGSQFLSDGSPAATASPDLTTGGGISSWLAYPRGPGCCCRVGGNGPIESETYLRTGVAAPFGGTFADTFKPGWDIEGGVRALFFNKAADAAWTADLSITHMHFNSRFNSTFNLTNFPLMTTNILGQPVTTNIPVIHGIPNGLDDTFVNLSGGREIYVWGGGPTTCNSQCSWRLGWDLGGRWGTSKLGIDEGGQTTGGEHHKTGSISGVFGSVHSDVEIPCGCWIMYFGVRAEYGIILSDILQGQNNANIETINLMFTFGGRF